MQLTSRPATISERAQESRELLATLSSETRQEMQKYEPYERQVLARFVAYTALANDNDWEMTDHSLSSVLYKEDFDGFSIRLSPGRYMANRRQKISG